MANIVMIDDDVELADTVTGMLKKAGHKATSIHTTQGAIEKLKASVPDLIILDVMFPDDPSAGMSLAIELRKHDALKKVPVIMMTSVNQHVPLELSERDIDADWLPIQCFVEKPFPPDELLQMVTKCLSAGHRPA